MAFELWCHRRILKIPLVYRVQNEEVLLRIDQQKPYLWNVIKTRSNAWVGHPIQHGKTRITEKAWRAAANQSQD